MSQGHRGPAPNRRRWARWLPLTALIAVVVLIVGLIVGFDDAPSAGLDAASPTPIAAKATPVSIAALSGLLLSNSEAAATLGSASVAGNPDMGDTVYQAMSDMNVVDADCMSLAAGLERSYRGSGFTAARQQFLVGTDPDRKLVQTVVSFADAAMAAQHVTATARRWNACAHRMVNLGAVGAEPDTWAVGDVGEADGILSASRTQEHGDGWMCRDGLAARNNIVIDIAVCGEDIPASVLPAFVGRVEHKIRGTVN